MTAHSRERNSARELNVVYADLNLDQPKEAGPIFDLALMFWPGHVFDAAADCRLVLNCEVIDIAQRNLNASFGLLRRLAGARSFGEIVELQAAHLSNQGAALMGQSEELATLSIKAAIEFVRGAYLGR